MPRRPKTPDADALPALLKASSLKEPPRAVLHRAYALKSLLPRRAPSVGEWLMTLLFDSGAQPVPAGLRSGSGSSERRVLYEARCDGQEPRQVDLRLRREPAGTVEIVGQCLPPWQHATVAARTGRKPGPTDLQDTGEFILRGVAAKGRTLGLTLTADGQTIVLDGIPLPGDGRPD